MSFVEADKSLLTSCLRFSESKRGLPFSSGSKSAEPRRQLILRIPHCRTLCEDCDCRTDWFPSQFHFLILGALQLVHKDSFGLFSSKFPFHAPPAFRAVLPPNWIVSA